MGGRNTPIDQLRQRLSDGFLEASLLVDGAGITIIHSSAARWRRCRIRNPVHAAFIKGVGDKTEQYFYLIYQLSSFTYHRKAIDN